MAPVVDYASNVRIHAYTDRNVGRINRVQRVGAQAIVGTFLTAATSIAEAEASKPTARERFWKRAIKMWIDIHTLPKTNPLHRIIPCVRQFYNSNWSPFHQVAYRLNELPLREIETILPFALAPWDTRLQAIKHDKANKKYEVRCDICVAVSSPARNEVVGAGGAALVPVPNCGPA